MPHKSDDVGARYTPRRALTPRSVGTTGESVAPPSTSSLRDYGTGTTPVTTVRKVYEDSARTS